MTRKYSGATLLAIVLLTVLSFNLPVSARSDDDEIKVRRVEIVLGSVTVRVNQTRTLYAEVTPRDADDQSIYWDSSNWEVAAVDGDGIVTGISPGTAEITATSHNDRVGRCTVTVPGTAITSDAFIPDIQNDERPEAAITGGERVTAAALRVAVDEAIRSASKGEAGVVTYQEKTTISTAALRGGAFVAEQSGGTVRILFQTLTEDDSIQGQLTIDPSNTSTEDKDIRVSVYSTGSKVDAVRSRTAAHLGADAVVVVLDHPGSYDMEVSVAAKVELTNSNEQSLTLYRWNGSKYVQMEAGNIYVDSNSFLHFSTTEGGEYAAVI